MGLFNFDRNAILGTVFKAASSVLGAGSRALGAAARTAAKVSSAASNIGKAAPTVKTTYQPTPPPPPAVAPAQAEGAPDLGRPIMPGSDKPTPPIMPEPLTPDAGELAKLRAELEQLKSQRDFLLQAQQAKDNKPFGAAAISASPDTFQQQMDVKAAIDNKRAANPGADDKETRLQAIDEYYYPEDEGAGAPDLAGELEQLEPGPNPF